MKYDQWSVPEALRKKGKEEETVGEERQRKGRGV